jgi:copper(I)-binding protein
MLSVALSIKELRVYKRCPESWAVLAFLRALGWLKGAIGAAAACGLALQMLLAGVSATRTALADPAGLFAVIKNKARLMMKLITAIATTLLSVTPAAAGPDENAIRHLPHGMFDRAESRLVIGPAVVNRGHAMAGWSQGDMQATPQHAVQHAQMHGAPQHGAPQHGAPQHGAMHGGPGKTFNAGSLTVETPWLRATPQGAQVAGGYMKIINKGPAPDRLLGGTLDRARRLEIHEMTMIDNVMRMRPLPNGIEIKPGETVELKPGGYHIMGMELQGRFTEGQTVKGTLQFEKAGSVNVEYAVRAIGERQHH